MSEFSSYLLVRDPLGTVVRRLSKQQATALLIPRAPWTVVVSAEPYEGLARPFPRALHYDYAADHGFVLSLLCAGRYAGKLAVSAESATSRFDAAAWVEHAMLGRREAASLARRLRALAFDDRAARDLAWRVFELPRLSWTNWRTLSSMASLELTGEHPGVVLLQAGKRASLEELDEAPAAVAPTRDRPSTPIDTSEFATLTAAFAAAAPLAARIAPSLAEVDLASIQSSRAWLDARKQIAPDKASAAVLAELERTVRVGRFHDEGDRATVVREAAAMLLGRCLVHHVEDPTAWLLRRLRAATTAEERAAWQITASAAGIELADEP